MSDSDLDLRVAWQRHIGRSPAAMRSFESVVSRHREAHRHYHTVRHVRWVVRHVTELGTELDDLGVVVAAAFFHDVVYDPARGDNEALSADLATAALAELGWTSPRTTQVADLVEGTAHHDLTDPTPEEAVLFAADLAVLAAEPSSYGDYVRQVRREYAHVDDAAWNVGRAAVLDTFLDRRTIFAPSLGLDGWEARARANLTAERSTLGESPQ